MTPWLRFLARVGTVLWLVMLAMIFSSCTPTPAEVEWDRCYATVNFQGEDVTVCEKDTVIVHP